MTIAILLKVGDGIVFGADSASTLVNDTGVVNVYFNAEKIINLHKELPIGLATYGLGNIDQRSITGLAKELRERFGGADPDWAIDKDRYTMAAIAQQVKRFFYDEYYAREYPKHRTDAQGNQHEQYATIGFMVAGYSAGERKAEAYSVTVDEQGACAVTQDLGRDEYAILARGQPEAVLRLVGGYSPRIFHGMVAAGVAADDAKRFLEGIPMEQLVQAYMPIQDGIDLVRFLAEVTEGFVRFVPGAPTVHEPIDLAAITYYEGFRWVQRKHYYPRELNPITPRGVVASTTP